MPFNINLLLKIILFILTPIFITGCNKSSSDIHEVNIEIKNSENNWNFLIGKCEIPENENQHQCNLQGLLRNEGGWYFVYRENSVDVHVLNGKNENIESYKAFYSKGALNEIILKQIGTIGNEGECNFITRYTLVESKIYKESLPSEGNCSEMDKTTSSIAESKGKYQAKINIFQDNNLNISINSKDFDFFINSTNEKKLNLVAKCVSPFQILANLSKENGLFDDQKKYDTNYEKWKIRYFSLSNKLQINNDSSLLKLIEWDQTYTQMLQQFGKNGIYNIINPTIKDCNYLASSGLDAYLKK